MLTSDIKWKEPYVSAGLNRKLAGVLAPGVYYGFEVDAPGGLLVRVWPGADPEYPDSVAVVDRDGYSLTVRQSGEDTVNLSGRAGSIYIILEATYAPNQETVVSLQAVTNPAAHHVVLARVALPEGAAAVTDAMIDYAPRSVGNPAALAMSYASSLMAVVSTNLDLKARLQNLEAWAKNQGYNAETLY